MVKISKAKNRGFSMGFCLIRLVRAVALVLSAIGLCLSVFWSTLLNARTWEHVNAAPGVGVVGRSTATGGDVDALGRTIPHTLIFTYKENILETKSPPLFYSNIMNTTKRYREAWGEPDAKVLFLDDMACHDMIEAAEPRLLGWFHNETHGMYKADICRVAALYMQGGYYFDADIRVVTPVHLDDAVSFATVRESKPRTDGKTNFFQAFLATAPKHPVLEEALRIMLAHYEGRHKLHGWMGVSTLGDAFVAIDPSKRGVVRLLKELKNVEEQEGYYEDLPRQIGIGCCCNHIVHDPEERVVYFYSRIVGAGHYCKEGDPSKAGKTITLDKNFMRRGKDKPGVNVVGGKLNVGNVVVIQ